MGLFSRRRPPSAPPTGQSAGADPQRIAPEFAEAHFALGNALREKNLLDEAAASYARAVACRPDLAEGWYNLGNAQWQLGRLDAAVVSFATATRIRPAFAEAHHNLGNVLTLTTRFAEALAAQQRALELAPKMTDAWLGLAHAQTGMGDLDAAVTSHQRALMIDPLSPEGHNDLGATLYKQGRIEEAIESYRRALALRPDFAHAWTGLLFCASHDASRTPDQLFAEHLRFGAQYEAAAPASPLRNNRDPERELRVGIVSGDLREHAVALFFEPILAYLAAAPSIALYAYHNDPAEDEASERMRGCFRAWTNVTGRSDDAVAQSIEGDGIDVLIDLSGHTAGNRLPVFARKPAPVQVSWIGYLGTTGLRAIDYYLGDALLLPAPESDALFTEKLVRLPAWAGYFPDAEAPAVAALPALANVYMTFGSFHRLSKLGSDVIALWSRLLREVPHSRLLLGGMPSRNEQGRLVVAFAREGIPRERLEFHERCGVPAYLALHHRVDIVLDAFPYPGGNTSTCALSMGVPVLTLAGATPASRQGAAIMGHAGLAQFVARDADDFVRIGVQWAKDLPALAQVRAGLRDRCYASAMGRPEVIATAVERALRTMWRRWCAGLPPESFEA